MTAKFRIELEKWWKERIKELKNKTISPLTLRGVYYLMRQRVGSRNMPKTKSGFYSAIEDLERITKISRDELKIISEPKINLITRNGESPVTKIKLEELDYASAIIYIEKSTIIEALEEDKSLTDEGIFIIKGMGFSTKEAIRIIQEAQKRGIPILTLTDFDPSGILIDLKLKESGIKTVRLGIDLELIKALGLKINDVREPLPKSKKKLGHYKYLQNKHPEIAKQFKSIGVKNEPYRIEIDAVFALAGKDKFIQEIMNRASKYISKKNGKILMDKTRKEVHAKIDYIFSKKMKENKGEMSKEAIREVIKELKKML